MALTFLAFYTNIEGFEGAVLTVGERMIDIKTYSRGNENGCKHKICPVFHFPLLSLRFVLRKVCSFNSILVSVCASKFCASLPQHGSMSDAYSSLKIRR